MSTTVIITVSKQMVNIQKSVADKEMSENRCPVNRSKGLKITTITLRNHVLEKYWDIINDKGFYFCPTKNCPIVYFNNKEAYYFSTEEVRSRVSYKEGPEPRPICYCLNILEHKILDEIVVNKCCTSLEDIKKYTGARTGKMCHITNPSGRCCGPQVNEVIIKGLQLLQEENSILVQNILQTVHSGCEYCQHENEFIKPSLRHIIDTCKSCDITWEEKIV